MLHVNVLGTFTVACSSFALKSDAVECAHACERSCICDSGTVITVSRFYHICIATAQAPNRDKALEVILRFHDVQATAT